MADQVIFKTAAFGGFDKASVLSYVDQQQKAAQGAQEELQKKIAGLEQSGREMSELLEENKKQIMDLENALQAEQAKNREANSLINTLNLEIARQGRTLEQKNQEIRQQQEACRQFQFKAEAMEYKAQKFDEASLDIGTVILEAKQTASGILAGAEARSKEITAEAEQRMQTAAADTVKFRQEVAQLKEMLGGVMDKLTEYGFCDDYRFCREYVAAYSKRVGLKKIKFDLKRLGAEEDAISAALEEAGGQEDEAFAAAEKYIRTHRNFVMAKLKSYLYSRGFSMSDINAAADRVKEEYEVDVDFDDF